MNCSAVAFAVLFLSLRCYCEKLDLNSDLTVPFNVIENREDKTTNDGNQLRSLHGGIKAMSKRNVNCGDGEMYCMDGQTCCLSDSGGFGCCPVPNAICCSNGVHCCPQGYICDYGSGGCRKSWSFVQHFNFFNEIHVKKKTRSKYFWGILLDNMGRLVKEISSVLDFILRKKQMGLSGVQSNFVELLA